MFFCYVLNECDRICSKWILALCFEPIVPFHFKDIRLVKILFIISFISLIKGTVV